MYVSLRAKEYKSLNYVYILVFLTGVITNHFVMYCKIKVDEDLTKTPQMLTYYRDLRSGLAPLLFLHIAWSTIFFSYDTSCLVITIQESNRDLWGLDFMLFFNDLALVITSAVILLELAEQSERCHYQISLKAFHHR